MAVSATSWRLVWEKQEVNDTALYFLRGLLCHSYCFHNLFRSSTY
jgi:hypothetical protein